MLWGSRRSDLKNLQPCKYAYMDASSVKLSKRRSSSSISLHACDRILRGGNRLCCYTEGSFRPADPSMKTPFLSTPTSKLSCGISVDPYTVGNILSSFMYMYSCICVHMRDIHLPFSLPSSCAVRSWSVSLITYKHTSLSGYTIE